jgi:hypothetical protein
MSTRNQIRDNVTGQYAFDGNMDRVCVCGHTLGIHCAGGFDCFAQPTEGHPFYVEGLVAPCDCQRFHQSRKKALSGRMSP